LVAVAADVPAGVGRTALGTARIRAAESDGAAAAASYGRADPDYEGGGFVTAVRGG
jgi:hypothetical protein